MESKKCNKLGNITGKKKKGILTDTKNKLAIIRGEKEGVGTI